MNSTEAIILGCYLSGAQINPAITASVFQSEAHKIIFNVIRELKAKGIDPDLMVLADELSNRGLIDKAGGYDKIAALTNGAYPSNIAFYETEVLRAYQRRSAIETVIELKESLENCHFPDIENAIKKLSELTTVEAQKERGILFSDLLKKAFPPDNWLITCLITTGLTILTGASKIGKSWLCLQIVAALDQELFFLGSLRAQKCDVLYLSLEDTEKRIQGRLQKQGITTFNGSKLETKRCTPSALRAYLKANPQFKVIIIDTFQKFMGLDDLNNYAETVNGMSALKEIADELDRAILVIHHTRKSAEIDSDHLQSGLGSTGLPGTADQIMTLRRKRGSAEATLQVSGRDVEDTTYSLIWDKDICSWSITQQEALKPLLSEVQQQILDLLESEAKNWTTNEIAEKTGIKRYEISRQARDLAAQGIIEKPVYGQWRLKSPELADQEAREAVKEFAQAKAVT